MEFFWSLQLSRVTLRVFREYCFITGVMVLIAVRLRFFDIFNQALTSVQIIAILNIFYWR